MRSGVVVLAVALVALACGRPVPFNADMLTQLGPSPQNLSSLDLRVLGTFELHAANRATIVVKNEAKAFGGRVVDDTTIALQVAGAQLAGTSDTLTLTFSRGAAADGAYTLRMINGAHLGQGIPVGPTRYQYQACYANVGSKCENEVPASTKEDRTVRVGIRQGKTG